MKKLCLLIFLATTTSGYARSIGTDTTVARYILQYDPSPLRIPGRSLPIGIEALLPGGQVSKTEGFLQGEDRWSKYKVEVAGGSFSNGKIKISSNGGYQKTDSITVNVYTRKWFLGGRNKWLFTQKIPYNFEDSINILTTGNIARAPGDHMQFGIRTWFNNTAIIDNWFKTKNSPQGFLFEFSGAHLSKSKGDFKIDTDPSSITNDKVKMVAILARNTAIRDSLQITLDYIGAYQCKVQSAGKGHDLFVTADAYPDSLIHAKLLKVTVVDSIGKKTYHYLVNTRGGSLTISTRGANGLDGRNGFDGSNGSNGADGIISTSVETTTAADGTIQTNTTTTQGPGSNGGRGADGENGVDGDNGFDGGTIHIHYTSAAKPFLEMIHALSLPGVGGSGGRGGRGGSGGSGGTGNPSGSNGLNGFDGRSGFDGAKGKPGKVDFIAL